MVPASSNPSKLGQHLSQFVYEPGLRSSRQPSATGSAQSTPEKPGGGSVSSANRQASKATPPATGFKRTSLQISPHPDAGSTIDDGPGNSTLESIESSDLSEIEEHASKRRRLEPRKEKPKKAPRGYAPPETYAHLNMLPDQLREGLDVIFSGINPGKMSATLGHHFAHPTNKFWPALYKGGFTDRSFTAADDHLMPDLFNFGLTNLVPRPTSEAAELSTHEMRIAVPSLLEKLKRYRPGLVCFVGKGIWDKFEDIVAKASTEPEKPWKPFELRLPEEAAAEDAKSVGIKLETDLSTTAIEREVDIPLEVDVKPNLMAKTTAQKRKAKPAFDWTQPRQFKLVHPAKHDRTESATLFWVVPSTSGLERTPRADLWRYFGLARAMSQGIQEGTIDMAMFRQIEMERVYEEVEKIKRKAEDKSRKSL